MQRTESWIGKGAAVVVAIAAVAILLQLHAASATPIRATSVGADRATRAVASAASSLTAEVDRARVETTKVLARSFAKLRGEQATIAAERAQLAAEQAQLNAEVQQLASRSAALAAEDATLRSEAAAIAAARSKSTGSPSGGTHDD